MQFICYVSTLEHSIDVPISTAVFQIRYLKIFLSRNDRTLILSHLDDDLIENKLAFPVSSLMMYECSVKMCVNTSIEKLTLKDLQISPINGLKYLNVKFQVCQLPTKGPQLHLM